MQTRNFEYTEERVEEKNSNSRRAAVSAILGGSALAAVATFGVLSIEAEDPQDAIGSINIADRTYFVTGDELPLIAIGVTGMAAIGLGIEAIRRKEEE